MSALARRIPPSDDSPPESPYRTFPEAPDFRGRPLEYSPDFPRQLFEFTRETGKSLTAFAAFLGTSRRVLNVWFDTHPEFMQANEASKALRTSIWEDNLGDAKLPAQVNAAKFILVNNSPDEYQMKVSVAFPGDADQKLSTPMLGAISETIERVSVTRRVVVRELIDEASDELSQASMIEGEASEVQESAAPQALDDSSND